MEPKAVNWPPPRTRSTGYASPWNRVEQRPSYREALAGSRAASLQNVGRNAVGNALRCLVNRFARQVGVPRRHFDVAVPEQLADYRQRLPERQRAGREGVTQIVHPYVFQLGPGPDGLPDTVEPAAAEAAVPVALSS